MMNLVNLLIKPASSECNLRCKYCFYHDIADNRQIKSYGLMSLDTLDKIVAEAFKIAKKSVIFSFQGGEPTLVGFEFYLELIKLVNKYNKNQIIVNYSIQTNGLLLNEDWCRFLKKHNFLVGISLDGYKEIHDVYRYDIANKGSFSKVLASIRLLKKHQVDFNILCVVNQINSKHPQKIYRFFRTHDLNYLQFIPCLTPLDDDNQVLSSENYYSFLDQVFQLWYNDLLKGKQISIRFFDNLIGLILGYRAQSCDLQGYCSSNLVIESNGDIYPCDFYVVDHYKIGNIDQGLENIYNDNKTNWFIEESLEVSIKCQECEFYQLCKGGCKRHRQLSNNQIAENVFCDSYYRFFTKNIKKLEHIAMMITK